MPGVTGTISVDLDLLDAPSRGLADALLPSIRPATKPGVLLAVVGSSAMYDSSSCASSTSSATGETVLSSLLLFSTEPTFSGRSGLSSSSSSGVLEAPVGVPRFLFPNCGVTAFCLGVGLRCDRTLRGADRLRCRLAEPLVLRGVACTGVRDRRAERGGGREACFAPKLPKSKPKDAWTVEALPKSVHCCCCCRML